MLSDVIVRKATTQDTRQLMLRQLPLVIFLYFPLHVVPILALVDLWKIAGFNPPQQIFEILFSIVLALCSGVFGLAIFVVLGQLVGFISPHSALSTQWVAVYGKVVVAEVTLDTWKGYSHLHQLIVRSRFRKQGIGSLLVSEVSQHALKPMYVQCEPKLLNFYTRLGFKKSTRETAPNDLQKLFNHIRSSNRAADIHDLVLW